jgi:hypothetical protein
VLDIFAGDCGHLAAASSRLWLLVLCRIAWPTLFGDKAILPPWPAFALETFTLRRGSLRSLAKPKLAGEASEGRNK